MDVKSVLVVQLAPTPERGSVLKASGGICTSWPVGWVLTAGKKKYNNKSSSKGSYSAQSQTDPETNITVLERKIWGQSSLKH